MRIIAYFERNAVIVSLLCHGIFLYFFSFTFPLGAVAHKPSFIFLGSILDKYDVSHVPNSKKNLYDPDMLSQQQITVRSSHSQFYPTKTTAVPKPIFSGRIKSGSKTFFKKDFSSSPVEEHKQEDALENLGIDPTVPPPPKLRLYER